MSYTYLAIAYTGHRQESFKHSLQALAVYMRNEQPAFSPIVHGHAVTHEHELPTDWPFWKQHALAMIGPCRALHVIVPPQWETRTLESRGVNAEVRYAYSRGKHLHVVTLDEHITRTHPDEQVILQTLTGGSL